MKFFWDLDLPSRRYKFVIMDGFCNCDKEKKLSLRGFVAVGVPLEKNRSNPKLKKFNYFGLLRSFYSLAMTGKICHYG